MEGVTAGLTARVAAASAAAGVALTFEEATQFHARKEAEEARTAQWVARHPEIQQLLHDLTAAVLRDKPDDVRAYAVGFFLRYRAAGADGDGKEDAGDGKEDAGDGKEGGGGSGGGGGAPGSAR